MWIGRLLFQARGLLLTCPKSFGANLFPFLSKNRFYRSCDWKTVFLENGQERDRWSPLAVFNETGMWNITFDWSFRFLWMVSASYRLGSKNIKNNHCIWIRPKLLRISPWEKPLVSYNPWFWVAVEGLQLCPVLFPAAYLYNPVILFKGIVFYWSLNGNTTHQYIISKYFVTAYKSSDHNK